MSFCLTWLLIYPLYIFIKERRGYFKIYLQISLISVLMHFYHDNFREYVFSRTRVLHAKSFLSFLFFILKINTNPVFSCFCLCRFSPDFSLIWRCHHCWWSAANMLTYARHLWPLSSEGFWACHGYGDTGHLFVKVISEGTLNSHLLPLPVLTTWVCHG